MAIFNNKKAQERELGFGNKNYKNSVRFINKDGSINVKRTGLGWMKNLDVYHWFINIPFSRLLLVILAGYLVANLIFACIYYAIGTEHFGGLETQDNAHMFMSLFFFSAQTLTTVGYGHVYPIGYAASSVSAIESLLGLLGFALATGLLYGRFSRPKADILYSKNMLVAPYQGINGLMFRISNKMQYELIEVEASVNISYNDPESKKREFDALKLEINRINFLPLSWTIVHPIDDESPIKGWTVDDIVDRDTEVIILIKAINDTFSQTVYSRYSYKAQEIVDRAKFKPLKQEADRTGKIMISVTDIHEFHSVETMN